MIQNYLKLFKLQLSCDFCCLFSAQQPTFPRGSPGAAALLLLPAKVPQPSLVQAFGILGQVVKHLLQAEENCQQPLPQQPCAAKGTECINSPFWLNSSLNVTHCYSQCVTSAADPDSICLIILSATCS